MAVCMSMPKYYICNQKGVFILQLSEDIFYKGKYLC